MKIINAINKVEVFVEKVEDLQEFIIDSDNLSKRDELSQRLDEFIKNLTTEVDEKTASDEIRRFLNFQSKLRKRSFHNSLLIYIQNRNATHVEGFRTWEQKFGRRVKKGAKAITIVAPRQTKKKDDETDDSDIDQQVKRKNFTFFIPVNVFDISDTEQIPGKEHMYATEPEWHAANTPDEKADKIGEYATQLASELGVNMTQNVTNRGEQGYAAGGHINISSNVAGVNKAATIIHEIAHELMHFKQSSVFFIEPSPSRAEKELQAESASYLVMRHYDLPAQHQSTYLALWKANKDSIRANLDIIKKVADFIITKIDEIANEDNSNQEKK
jgi:Zn-dependent peptidase ImmA (M78 family)